MTVPEDDLLHAANHILRPKDSVSLQDLFDNATVSVTHLRGWCQPSETSAGIQYL